MLLVARAAPMAIMALPASPARPQVKLSNSPVVECWSRSLCDSIPVGRRRRRVVVFGASGRKQVSVTAAPIRTTVASPRSDIYNFPDLLRMVRRDGRTLRFVFGATCVALALIMLH